MNFTVLDDGRASLICNDCITEAQLDLGYSETELGCCDECGQHGRRLWPSLPSMGVIIGLSMIYVEEWARHRGLAGSDQIRLYGTDNDHGGPTLQGMRIERECVVLLPGSERGRRWYMFEQELEAYGSLTAGSIKAATISAGKITSNHLHFNVQATNQVNLPQYASMLYGKQLMAKPLNIITNP